MALSKKKIQRWYKMLIGKSIYHVKQDIGLFYNKFQIMGYYNDLTEKVLRDNQLGTNGLPCLLTEKDESVVFPISVFQYGLGAYDLFLSTKDSTYLSKFALAVDWALENQQENGAWNNFYYVFPQNPFSAMAQGEGVSLLVRAYTYFSDIKYLLSAKKAIDFMVTSIELGGTAKAFEDKFFLLEFTHKSAVLNGWIFAIFGLYDYTLISRDDYYLDILNRTLLTLKNEIPNFDNGFWSLYNLDRSIIASRFYHKLHIALLKALYDLSDIDTFKYMYQKWEKYDGKLYYRLKAFLIKAVQKLKEQ